MTRMIAAISLAAVVSLAACGDGDPSGTVINGSIQGSVTDNTGATVANAAVALSGNGQAARTTNSGADGGYTFADVRPGTYTLAVTPPTGFTIGAAGTSSVTVASGAQAGASAFVLNRLLVNGNIIGTVTDHTGGTVANAMVALSGNAQPTRTTSSGANGGYTFADVPPGTYTLAVTPPLGYTIGVAGTASVTVASGALANAAAIVLNRMSPDSAFAAVVHARLQAATATNEFAGTVLVMHNGRTIFEGAYGLADREKGIANMSLTQFRIGSMNKMVTATAALQLVQAGKLRLDATVGTYLTDYPNDELAAKVTLHHLLTHTGGTGDIFGPQFMANRTALRTIDDYLQLYGTRALQFTPGAQHVYSNYGFMLLGAIVERVGGASYYDQIAARVHGPAGMTATGSAPEDSLVPGRAVGYTRQLVANSLVSNAPLLPYRGTPAGGGYSTVGDMARFAVALREHRLLDAAHTTLMLNGKVPVGNGWQYAYGFIDRFVGARRFVGHSGGAAGMNGDLAFEPGGGYVVVVLSNLDPPAATNMSAFILERLPQR